MALQQRMTFGVDLVEQTFYHLEFLKTVNSNTKLSRKAVLKRAVYRYENFWLPLAAEHPNECLSAPLDIEWVWHCHMLSPKAYEQDCHRIVQRTVNHTLFPPVALQRARNRADAFWSEKYREPFYIDCSTIPDADKDLNFSSNISYDILSAAERQTTFFYQVSLPHYKDKTFIEGALERYKKFLYLRQNNPGEFIVPCYDIDIVWHTHQLNPVVYKNDTVRITGSLFSHDDSVNDRTEGSKLSIADKRTRELWTTFYRESFSSCGSMYRGQPPNGQMYTLTKNDEFECCAKSCIISLDRLTLNLSGKDLGQKYSFVISTAGSPGSEVKRYFILKPPAHNQPGGNKAQTWSKVGSVPFDTHHEHGLLFTISHKSGLFGTKKNTLSAYLDLSPLMESPTGASKIVKPIKSRLTFQTNASVDIEFCIQNLKIQSANLQLEEGLYKKQSFPRDIQQLFGPVPMGTLPLGNDMQCRTATHILKNHLGTPSFKVRTLHSAPLMTSVIQVCFKDKLCSIAHLVAADQLPLLTQVSPTNFATALNPKEGERAILIKNNGGDWGIVFGQWTGVRKGRWRIPGSCGTLRLTFYKMSTGKCIQTDLVYTQKLYTVTIESSTSDLMNGSVKIGPHSHKLAENIALVFAISLLHVLCVPRLKGWPEGKPICVSYKRGSKLIEPVPSDYMKCIRAAGLLVNTPSNYFISQYGGQFWALCGARGTSNDQTFIESSPEWRALPGGVGFEYSGDAGCGSCVGVRGWGGGYGFIGAGCGGDGGGCGDGGCGCGGGGCGGGGCGGGGGGCGGGGCGG